MLGWVVLCLVTLRFYRVAGQGECTDLRGRLIAHGLHYVPGPDTCTLCVCDNGLPKVCKAVLCSPPQDCRSFRVGNTCCEFICLDDVVKPASEGAEANVRMAAGGAAAVVLLTVVLVVYRVRKQKRRRPPHTDDQRSLTSIGYISGSMGYMGGTCETALAAWKPPGNYMPRGEAPPPYEEAMAQCRQEQVGRVSNEPPFHRSYPATVETLARPDEPMPCSGHAYANISRPIQQLPNPQNCYNAPLLQPVHPPEQREPASMQHHPLAPNMVGFPSAIRLTGSLGAISNRGLLSLLQREPDADRAHLPLYPTTQPMHSIHRTIPVCGVAGAGTGGDMAWWRGGGVGGGGGGAPDVRRSFHRERATPAAAPAAPAPPAPARSMPRNLNLAATAADPTDICNIRTSAAGVSMGAVDIGVVVAAAAGSRREDGDGEARPVTSHATRLAKQDVPPPPPPTQTLPLTVDKPSCVCSYSGAGGPGVGGAGGGAGGADDVDDYRSECENCKAASSSRWSCVSAGGGAGGRGGAGGAAGWGACGGAGEEGTQTLQRRAPPPAPPPPATATLPQPVTKTRTIMGPPSNWENWFNTIHDSDTESEEE